MTFRTSGMADDSTRAKHAASPIARSAAEPARGPQADRRSVRVHLRRVRRACNDIIREELEEKAERRENLPEAPRSRRVLDEYVIGQDPRRRRSPSRCTTTTSAWRRRDRRQGRGRAREVEHPADRSDRLRARPARRDARAPAQRAVHHRRRHHPDRGGLRRRRTSRTSSRSCCRSRDYDVEKAQTGIVYIDEIDKISPARARTRRSPATCRARACSRRC